MPAGVPWQKKPIASASDRMKMVQLAVVGLDVEVSDYEINRLEPSYAIESAKMLHRDFPGAKITWIIGSDALPNLHTWRDIEELTEIIDFLVIHRPGYSINTLDIDPKVRWSALEIPALDISATEVRLALSQGRDVSTLIPANVAGYITEKGLYGAA